MSLSLTGCPGSDIQPPPPPPPPGLHIVELDSIWILDSERFSIISIRVEPPETAENREMLCQIQGNSVGTHFRLYDDGSFGRWYDSAGFADSVSGDNVPNNATFSRRINSLFTSSEGDYRLSFALSGGQPHDTLKSSIIVRRNSAPELIGMNAPDSIASGISGLEFLAEIADNDGIEDVVAVEVEFLTERERSLILEEFTPGFWAGLNENSIAARLPTASYQFRVKVADHYLNQLNEWIYSDTLNVWLENLPPVIRGVNGPDTLILPEEGEDTFEFEIVVYDDQGVTDLDSLLLELSDPDRVLARIIYYDDGEQPNDSIAGDGRYHPGFTVNDTNKTGILYTFKWIPTDGSPQRGEPVETTLIFLEPSGGQPEQSGGDARNTVLRHNKNYQKFKW